MSKIRFDFEIIEPKLQKKLVQGTVIPRPIAWVETKNENDSINLAPFSYYTMLSPTLVGISFQGKKDTLINLMREKTGIIHSVSMDSLEVMDNSSYPYELNQSEVDELKINLENISNITFEVELLQTIELEESAILAILKVTSVSVDESVFDSEKQYILADKLNPVARLAGPNYARIEPLNYKRKY